ncbi:hypothetical protein C8R47DRAFT_1281621 [Mycena vitilis]|nr:hypothetical protein C8R47DRAFT_1281621 [Mycena vitilis]
MPILYPTQRQLIFGSSRSIAGPQVQVQSRGPRSRCKRKTRKSSLRSGLRSQTGVERGCLLGISSPLNHAQTRATRYRAIANELVGPSPLASLRTANAANARMISRQSRTLLGRESNRQLHSVEQDFALYAPSATEPFLGGLFTILVRSYSRLGRKNNEEQVRSNSTLACTLTAKHAQATKDYPSSREQCSAARRTGNSTALYTGPCATTCVGRSERNRAFPFGRSRPQLARRNTGTRTNNSSSKFSSCASWTPANAYRVQSEFLFSSFSCWQSLWKTRKAAEKKKRYPGEWLGPESNGVSAQHIGTWHCAQTRAPRYRAIINPLVRKSSSVHVLTTNVNSKISPALKESLTNQCGCRDARPALPSHYQSPRTQVILSVNYERQLESLGFTRSEGRYEWAVCLSGETTLKLSTNPRSRTAFPPISPKPSLTNQCGCRGGTKEKHSPAKNTVQQIHGSTPSRTGVSAGHVAGFRHILRRRAPRAPEPCLSDSEAAYLRFVSLDHWTSSPTAGTSIPVQTQNKKKLIPFTAIGAQISDPSRTGVSAQHMHVTRELRTYAPSHCQRARRPVSKFLNSKRRECPHDGTPPWNSCAQRNTDGRSGM